MIASAKPEVGTLVAAFNRMTTDLQQSHQELEARRRYMEILLANINAGVVSFERTGMLSTMNRAAQQLLGVRTEVAVERDYREVFVSAEFAQLRRMIGDLLPESLGSAEEGGRESQGQLRLHHDGQAFTLLVTATPLTDERGDVLGGVCFFEDVTQIIRVERMEASPIKGHLWVSVAVLCLSRREKTALPLKSSRARIPI